MSSLPIRNQLQDQLLTPRNSALLIIDYQQVPLSSTTSMDSHELVTNIVGVAKTAKLFGLPIVLSTGDVKTGRNQPTIPQLMEVLKPIEEIDRTTINAWEDKEFLAAVKATGHKKLIIAALWTEACLTFPTLDAIRDGYEVYPIVDAVGGTSLEAHRTALERMVQAGAKPTTFVQVLCELQRDWARTETVPQSYQILLEAKGRK